MHIHAYSQDNHNRYALYACACIKHIGSIIYVIYDIHNIFIYNYDYCINHKMLQFIEIMENHGIIKMLKL